MPRYKLTVSYEGTDFHGWSDINKTPRTVASTLKPALRQLHGYGGPQPRKRPNTPEALAFDALLGLRIDAASRTDSGVHAARQVVSVSVTDADGQTGTQLHVMDSRSVGFATHKIGRFRDYSPKRQDGRLGW